MVEIEIYKKKPKNTMHFKKKLWYRLLQKDAIPTFLKVNNTLFKNSGVTLSSSMQVPQSTSTLHLT